MRQREYIGISGVVNQEQQAELVEAFTSLGLHEKRILQLGVKATHKTQMLEIENKYGREWYPVGGEIRSAIHRDIGIAGVAQVCFDEAEVYNANYRDAFMRRLYERANTWLTSVQLDMLPWHTHPELLEGIVGGDAPGPDLLLQCHSSAMEQLPPREIAKKLADIAEHIDYVLFDASCGTGLRLDADRLLRYLDAAANEPGLQDTRLAIAGGLHADVVRQELPKILRCFPTMSWDAEGRLHPINHERKHPLDLQTAKEYLRACAEVLE